MDEATGSIGTYKIVRRLAGAGAELFLVRSAAGARRVLQMIESDDPDALDEARQQLAVAATLEHAAVDRPVDVFDHEGKLVIAYDEFDGLTLADILEELVDHGRSIPPQAVWYLAYQLFGALARAHSATNANGDFVALCHGHLAPAHVLVGPQGEVRIRGFGLAPVVGAAGARGVALTPGYAAPEQKGAARVTPRGDVYSAAAIVWALGAAQRPGEDGGKLPVSALVPSPPPQLTQALDTALELALPKRKVTSIEIEQHFEALVAATGRTALKEAVGQLRPARAHMSIGPRPGGSVPPPGQGTAAGGSVPPAAPAGARGVTVPRVAAGATGAAPARTKSRQPTLLGSALQSPLKGKPPAGAPPAVTPPSAGPSSAPPPSGPVPRPGAAPALQRPSSAAPSAPPQGRSAPSLRTGLGVSERSHGDGLDPTRPPPAGPSEPAIEVEPFPSRRPVPPDGSAPPRWEAPPAPAAAEPAAAEPAAMAAPQPPEQALAKLASETLAASRPPPRPVERAVDASSDRTEEIEPELAAAVVTQQPPSPPPARGGLSELVDDGFGLSGPALAPPAAPTLPQGPAAAAVAPPPLPERAPPPPPPHAPAPPATEAPATPPTRALGEPAPQLDERHAPAEASRWTATTAEAEPPKRISLVWLVLIALATAAGVMAIGIWVTQRGLEVPPPGSATAPRTASSAAPSASTPAPGPSAPASASAGPSASTSAATASASVSASASATASASASASTAAIAESASASASASAPEPPPVGDTPDPEALGPTKGYVRVLTTVDAQVTADGIPIGPVNKAIEVACGKRMMVRVLKLPGNELIHSLPLMARCRALNDIRVP